MAEKCNPRGLTRSDALFAGVACLVLVLLVPVLLAKPRERSIRTACAANLARIGKTMFVYAADYEGNLPRAGGRNTVWGPVANWMAFSRNAAFVLNAVDGSGGKASISSSFYLLVKYYEAPTRLFLCRGDKGTSEFTLKDLVVPTGFELIDAWDFGPPDIARKSCSFAYHTPYCLYPLTTSRDPNLAVAADRNPWLPNTAGEVANMAEFRSDLPGTAGTPEQARVANAFTHRKDGQNVLFLDGRVEFETRAYCGLDQDNIYTMSAGGKGYPVGLVPAGNSVPASERDSLLVHDFPQYVAGDPSSRR